MESDELKRMIKNRNLKPSDLFDKYELTRDPAVKEAINYEVEMEIHFRDQKLNEEIEKEIEEEKKSDLIPGDDPEGSGDSDKDGGDDSFIPD